MIRSSLYDYFAKLSDSRLNRNKIHNLADIIVLSILVVICGAESWDFLKKILHLPNGIPSHDTINRVFSMLKPDKFEIVFISWVNSLRDNNIDKEVISIDGKTIRGSKDSFHETVQKIASTRSQPYIL